MLLNPFGSRDAPAKHVILRHGELSTAPEKARQIRSDSLQRSSEDCFHQAYRRSERGGGLNSESGFLSALRTSLRFIPFELMLLTTVGSLAEASLLSKKKHSKHISEPCCCPGWHIPSSWWTWALWVLFFRFTPTHTHLPRCCEYSPAHKICINPPLEVVPNRLTIDYCLSKGHLVQSSEIAARLEVNLTSHCFWLQNFYLSLFFSVQVWFSAVFRFVSWCDVCVNCISSLTRLPAAVQFRINPTTDNSVFCLFVWFFLCASFR